MAVAEQPGRKCPPHQKNATAVKKIDTFCCDSLGKLISPRVITTIERSCSEILHPACHGSEVFGCFLILPGYLPFLWKDGKVLSFFSACNQQQCVLIRNAVLPQGRKKAGVLQKIILVSALGELGPAAASCVTDHDLCLRSGLAKLRLVFKPVTHLDMHLHVLLVQKRKFS